MRAKEFITENHDAVMYKAPHMMGQNRKMVHLNWPTTLGRKLVSFSKKDDGSWIPKHEEAERYLDMFLDIMNNHPELVADNAVDEMALPADWDPTMLGHDKTFKSRLEYAKDRAQRLGGGSSRVAFVIPDQGRETVLKIAKNKKGIAQNEAEVDILNDGYLGKLDIVIPLIDYDKQNPTPTWIQTEKANKINRKRLEQLLYCDELDGGLHDFMAAVYSVLGQRHSWVPTMKQINQDLEDTTMSQEEIDIFFEYVNEVAMLVSSSTVLPDDFYNIGNWGEYNGRPVIIDVGFTEAVKPLYQR